MKIALIRERKLPIDFRVALTPAQCRQAQQKFPVSIIVEPSPDRCFTDEEYRQQGIEVSEQLADCRLFLGVEEVPAKRLVSGKTYFMFSHTTEKQPQNQHLLWSVLDKDIRLIDYEALKDERGNSLIAFDRFAGIAGAHNALWTYGRRTGKFAMQPMKDFPSFQQAKESYTQLEIPAIKVALTGVNALNSGAAETLLEMGFRQLSPQDFLQKEYRRAVFVQLERKHYTEKKEGGRFEEKDFLRHPEKYQSAFAPFYRQANILLHCTQSDRGAPALFDIEEMRRPEFNIQVLADLTGDSATQSTVIAGILHKTTSENPVYGFDPISGTGTAPHLPGSVDVLAPEKPINEIAADASTYFGEQFLEYILPEWFREGSDLIRQATVTEDGVLTRHFRYLEDYAGSP